MFIELLKDFIKAPGADDYSYFKVIDFASVNVYQLFEKYPEDRQSELVEVLNKINNQEIQSIDLKAARYVKDGKYLPFNSMATSERLFLIAAVAEKINVPIVVVKELKELTKTALTLFFKMFGESKYVNVCATNVISKEYYITVKESLML